MKYELDWTRSYDNGHHTVIAILTGLPIEDIIEASPTRARWGGQRYVETFRKLGFNTNDRFIKFDPRTEYPCMMRYHDVNEDRFWGASVYYDGKIQEGNCEWLFEDWLKYWNGSIIITSMLQVWI